MTEIPRPTLERRNHFVLGVILVVFGVISIVDRVWQPTEDVGGWVLLAIGLGFLAAFAYTRQYGYLVPGGIFSGLGVGVIVARAFTTTGSDAEGGAVVLGLGVGFLAIWAIGELVEAPRNRWWPLIPGSILGFVGTALLIGGEAVRALDYWGVILVGLGLIVMWRASVERRADQARR